MNAMPQAVFATRRAAELHACELAEVRTLLEHALPGIDLADYERRHTERVVLARVDGKLVSHAALLVRVIDVGGVAVRVAGIGGVATWACYRGRGLARAVIQTALEAARQKHDVDFGFLMCPDALVPYYTALGWQAVDASLTCLGAAGQERVPYPAMARPLADTAWPDGPIDLAGPRF